MVRLGVIATAATLLQRKREPETKPITARMKGAAAHVRIQYRSQMSRGAGNEAVVVARY